MAGEKDRQVGSQDRGCYTAHTVWVWGRVGAPYPSKQISAGRRRVVVDNGDVNGEGVMRCSSSLKCRCTLVSANLQGL